MIFSPMIILIFDWHMLKASSTRAKNPPGTSKLFAFWRENLDDIKFSSFTFIQYHRKPHYFLQQEFGWSNLFSRWQQIWIIKFIRTAWKKFDSLLFESWNVTICACFKSPFVLNMTRNICWKWEKSSYNSTRLIRIRVYWRTIFDSS